MTEASDRTPGSAEESGLDISVLVPTYNRAAVLERLLQSVAGQQGDGVSAEILVIDNASTDRTRAVVEDAVARDEFRIRYLFEPRQGRSFALNRGIMEARGAICAPVDDDQLMPPDYLQQLAASFRAYPEAAFIGGKVLPLWEHRPPEWLTPELWSPLGLADYGETPFRVDRHKLVTLITCAFRTATLRAIQGFDIRMARSQDAEIIKRMVRRGEMGMYDPDLVLLHGVPATRATKDHYRRWFRRHGRYMAIEQDPDFEQSRYHPLGVPAHLYTQLLKEGWEWLHTVPRDRRRAFIHETRLQLLAGYLAQRWRQPRPRVATRSQ